MSDSRQPSDPPHQPGETSAGDTDLSRLLAAARAGDLGPAVEILRRRPDTLANFMDGRTSALHEGVRCGHAEVFPLLLQAGADPLLRNGEGRTPLEIARRVRPGGPGRDARALDGRKMRI